MAYHSDDYPIQLIKIQHYQNLVLDSLSLLSYKHTSNILFPHYIFYCLYLNWQQFLFFGPGINVTFLELL